MDPILDIKVTLNLDSQPIETQDAIRQFYIRVLGGNKDHDISHIPEIQAFIAEWLTNYLFALFGSFTKEELARQAASQADALIAALRGQ